MTGQRVVFRPFRILKRPFTEHMRPICADPSSVSSCRRTDSPSPKAQRCTTFFVPVVLMFWFTQFRFPARQSACRYKTLVSWQSWFVRSLAAAMVLWSQLPLCADVTVLHHFGPANPGPWPEAGLAVVGDRLYGTNSYSILSLNTDGSDYRDEHIFSGN
jgi:hypothetical protein